jgi:hypothetical protein
MRLGRHSEEFGNSKISRGRDVVSDFEKGFPEPFSSQSVAMNPCDLTNRETYGENLSFASGGLHNLVDIELAAQLSECRKGARCVDLVQ